MTFIQRVRFIHNEFEQICGGDRLKVDVSFQKQCCLEIRFLIKDDNVKGRFATGSDAVKAVDDYFLLAFRMGKLWNLIDDIFNLW